MRKKRDIPTKRVVLLVTSMLLMLGARAQQLPLSESATASLLTCGAGEEFYSTFGHSAIRITDKENGIDVVYNYGTFDFDTPHFYWEFMKGRLNYCQSRTSFARFMDDYTYAGRSVWEQRLNLSVQEVNNLYVALEWNHEPENRYYLYDFFLNNCATRVRDMLKAATGWSDTNVSTGVSYRAYLHEAAGGGLQWWMLGVDLLLGLPTDHKCTAWEAMFYPIYMSEELQKTTREGDERQEKLAGEKTTLYVSGRETERGILTPMLVFGILLAGTAALTLLERKKGWAERVGKVADRVLFAIVGIAGLFLIFMWVGTEHYCTKGNMNILWLSPLYVFFAIFLKESVRWAVWLQIGMLVAAAVYVLWCGLSAAIIPMITILIIRTSKMLKGGSTNTPL